MAIGFTRGPQAMTTKVLERLQRRLQSRHPPASPFFMMSDSAATIPAPRRLGSGPRAATRPGDFSFALLFAGEE